MESNYYDYFVNSTLHNKATKKFISTRSLTRSLTDLLILSASAQLCIHSFVGHPFTLPFVMQSQVCFVNAFFVSIFLLLLISLCCKNLLI